MSGINKIRKALDPSCPPIYSGSWDRLKSLGWRWVVNVKDHVEGLKVINDLQQLHGPLDVTVGHSWDTDRMKPNAHFDNYGIYVRDVDEQAAKFNENFDNIMDQIRNERK